MQKYKGQYRVLRQRNTAGKYTDNKDDTYIPCRKGVQIYRYNADTLALSFNTSKYAISRISLMSAAGVELDVIQNGDAESAWLFPEKDFKIVARLVFASRIKKRELTPEQKEAARQRMEYARKSLPNKSNT